jgi:outer membrane protein TolC
MSFRSAIFDGVWHDRATMKCALAIAVLVAAGSASAQPGTLTLEQAMRRGVDVAEDVAIAHARREQADAAIGRERAALFPTVTATGSYTRRAAEVTRDVDGMEVVVQSANAFGGNVTVVAPIFDGKVYPLIRAARRSRDAATLDERESRRRATFDTAAAYLVALGAEQIVQAAVQRRDFAKARQREVSARVDAQLVGRNDLTQADLELANAELEVITGTSALDEAYQQLAFWTGAAVSGPLVAPTWLYDRAAKAGAPAVDRERPDLAAARTRIAAAAEEAREPGRRLWPTLDFTGQVRFTNEPGLSGRNVDGFVGLVATWELWDGGTRAADSRDRAHAVDVAKLEATQVERQARAEVAAAHARLRGAQASIVVAESVGAAAARHAGEVSILYGKGLVRALEVVDAGARKFDADVALVRARVELAVAYLAVVDAAGGDPLEGAPRQ